MKSDKAINFRVDKIKWDKLKIHCKKNDVSVGHVMRSLVNQFLKTSYN